MAKFYFVSGTFRTIKDAPDIKTGAIKAVTELVNNPAMHTLFLEIGEQGFNGMDMAIYPLIPFLRDVGCQLPSDEVLIQNAKGTLGIEEMSAEEQEWFLYGDTPRE